MITEDYLKCVTLKKTGDKLKTTSDNPLLPINKDSCFGDYPKMCRFKKPKLFVPTPKEECPPTSQPLSPAWERSTVVCFNKNDTKRDNVKTLTKKEGIGGKNFSLNKSLDKPKPCDPFANARGAR